MKSSSLFIFIVFSFALSAETFRGPISKSSGGAGRAGLQSMESAFANPALLPFVKASEMAVYYQDGYLGPSAHRNAWGVGVIDAEKDVYFPGALHYVRTRKTGVASGAANGEIWHAGVGKILSERLAIGASAYRAQYDVEGDQAYTQWNGSLGVLVLINPNIGVAYVLDNLVHPGSRVPRGLREDMKQGLGVYAQVAELIKIRGELERSERFNPDKKMAYSLAVETMISEWMLFRGGYKRDELADASFWTTGFGFNGPRLRLDYAFEKNAKGTGGAVHSVDLSVPF